MALSVTEAAASRIREIIAQQGLSPDHGVRLGVKSGGCSGLSYLLEIDQPADRDRVYESFGLQVFCDPKSYLYLNGTQIDFAKDLLNGGFRFENPNVSRACGCGTSFTTD